MKNTVYVIIATCVAMLATSGIVALATAAPSTPQVSAGEVEVEFDEAAFDAWVSDEIDKEYRRVLGLDTKK
ncbi:hypothetical protein ACFL6C_06025 [Myxococcota bacterium]